MTTKEKIDFINELLERTTALEEDYRKLTREIEEESLRLIESRDLYQHVQKPCIELSTYQNRWNLNKMLIFFQAKRYNELTKEGGES
jgi:hypothetical protein